MYLSHNIVQQLIRISVGLDRLQQSRKRDSDSTSKLAQQISGKAANTIFHLANNLGISISLKDAAKLLSDKTLETQDFRGLLLENFKSAWKLALTAAESDSIAVSPLLLTQVNRALGTGCVEDWKLKFREAGEAQSLLYDDLLELAAPEVKQVGAEKFVREALDKFTGRGQENRIYRISQLVYDLLKAQPFLAFNKYSIVLIAEFAQNRLLGIDFAVFPTLEFFVQQHAQILKIFQEADSGVQEVGWHELFLTHFADSIEQLSNNIVVETNGQQHKASKPFLDLNRRQLKILKYLQTIPTVKREDYVQMTDVSAMTAYRDLQELLKHKLIKSIGTGRGTKYTLYSR